ncbi:MAG: phosphate ABC transporter substrate-binding protein [Candidatus Omnitrophota bacterium]
MTLHHLKSTTSLLITIVICSFLSSCAKHTGKKLILAGSTSVQPFAELWAEAYTAKHPEAKVVVQGGGSSAGIESALTGVSDIGMSSRELQPDEESDSNGQKKLSKVLVALDAIAIIANASSSLADLSSEQLRDLFAGRISKIDNLPITVVTREEGSGTRKSFEETVMRVPGSKKSERISNSALVQDSNGAVREIVAGDPNAVGYISLGLVDKRVKPLAIDGILPTVETVKDKRYGIFRPFLFILKNRNNPLAEDFINFCLSEEGQDIVAKKGLIKIEIMQ